LLSADLAKAAAIATLAAAGVSTAPTESTGHRHCASAAESTASAISAVGRPAAESAAAESAAAESATA
jgi:hypothetical protein